MGIHKSAQNVSTISYTHLQGPQIYLVYIYNSMEHSTFWDTDSYSGSQEAPCIVWNRKIHYRFHKRPPPAPIVGQINPLHAFPSHFLKIHFNIILPFTPGSCKWTLPSGLPTKDNYATHLSPIRTICSAHFIFVGRIETDILCSMNAPPPKKKNK